MNCEKCGNEAETFITVNENDKWCLSCLFLKMTKEHYDKMGIPAKTVQGFPTIHYNYNPDTKETLIDVDKVRKGMFGE